MTATTKKKRNVWTDPSPYGTYEGEKGNPDQWSSFFNAAWNTFKFHKVEAISFLKQNSPYAILGVETSATQEQLKTAWRKLVLVNHPDHGGDRNEFEKVMAAYSALKA